MEEDKKNQNTENANVGTQNLVSDDSAVKEEKPIETQDATSIDVEKKETKDTTVEKESTDEDSSEKKENKKVENTENAENKESTIEEQPKENTDELIEEKKEDDIKDDSKSEKIYPDVAVGASVKIHQKIKEKKGKEEKERIQIFEGIVLVRKGGSEIGATVTVRKICKGGFEVKKIYPLHSPVIDKIEVLRQAKVHQSKLGFFKRTYKKKLKYA